MRVLLIEDQSEIRLVARGCLEDDGYAVAEAQDGEEGLPLARAWCPQVILCDLYMPGTSGADFIRAYRDGPAPHAPVIVMSAGGEQAEAEAQVLRPDAYLVKPFDLDDLLAAVRQVALVGGPSRPDALTSPSGREPDVSYSTSPRRRPLKQEI